MVKAATDRSAVQIRPGAMCSNVNAHKGQTFYFVLITDLNMKGIILTKDFRITIPKNIREKYQIRPGQKIQIEFTNHSIKLTPLKKANF